MAPCRRAANSNGGSTSPAVSSPIELVIWNRPRLTPVLHLLLREPQNPRALAFQTLQIQALVGELAGELGATTIREDDCVRAMEELTDSDLGVLEGSSGYPSVAARQAFAQKLNELAAATHCTVGSTVDAALLAYRARAAGGDGMSASVNYHVRHETSYEYSGDVVHGHQLLHLTPREMDYQSCAAHEIHIDPAPTYRAADVDTFGNPVTRLEFDRPHRRLEVIAQMRVHSRERAAPVACDESWERARSRLFYSARPPGTALLEASRFRFESPYVRIKQRFTEYAEECFEPGRPLLECADALTQKLFAEMTYAPGATTINTPLLDVLSTMRGVCQDYAHLMIACLRARGFAARYVSGYLRTVPAPDAPVLVGADASHAWVAVFCPQRRLGRVRSHQRRACQHQSHHAGVGPGLRRCLAAARCHRRRRPSHVIGPRDRHAARD